MKDIDELNILQAALKAMQGAVSVLPSQTPDFILIDGTQIPNGFQQQMCQTIVKGDTKSTVIAAASILAKVHRLLHVFEAASNECMAHKGKTGCKSCI